MLPKSDPYVVIKKHSEEYKQEARNNIIRELVETERYYVRQCEILQNYATALSKSGLLPRRTIHRLFSNSADLLAFHRKFLAGLEVTNKLPWEEQRWGWHFLQAEEGFRVYEPYCANFSEGYYLDNLHRTHRNPLVSNRVLQMQESLANELPAFLIHPIGRVCKYPLLIEHLLKNSSHDTHQYHDELKSGLAAMKRVVDMVNDVQRRIENMQTVVDLRRCVVDWRGHEVDTFGALLLDDTFVMSRTDPDARREFRVFLFERIILFCVDALAAPAAAPLNQLRNRPRRLTTPLLLKGTVLVANVRQVEPVGLPSLRDSRLDVWWEGKDGLEVFTLCHRREGCRAQWETQITRLIRECAERRAEERGARSRSSRVYARQDSSGGFDSDSDDTVTPDSDSDGIQ
ncbi:Dbl homology domain-containing protein [Mycena olivaceomarginata]|nr:Dbl homology domain-containing protein [Mycena olivaceomarginata]